MAFKMKRSPMTGKISGPCKTAAKRKFCLLYTSPSPRDRG